MAEPTPETTPEPEVQEPEETRTPEARTPKPNEKAAKELEELKAAALSKEERVLKEAQEAKAAADQARADALRWKIAARAGITEEDAELFLTGADEETLTRQAERLKERTAQQPAKGTYVPGVGKQPASPPSPSEQIAAAEAAKDYETALALKAQMIADLARNR